jgi:ADP-ribose pyrophosphatase YjhB (NUDIX family)/GNAT superfamily N-acetyltransferase
MPTPEFVLALRARIGHEPLWMPGVTAVVRNAQDEVLLVRRADTGEWSLVSGILEPGEQPAAGLLREIEEETGVTAELQALTGVWTLPAITYPNGDQARYLDLCFLARHISGHARVNDDESLEVGWFPVDQLPDGLVERSRVRLARALAYDGSTWFEGAMPSTPPSFGHHLVDSVGGAQVRRATTADLPAIVALLAGDALGAGREPPGRFAAYERAFAAIDADPAHLLVVLEDDATVVGTLQLSFLPGLSRGGAWRGQIEAVRVAASHRGQGLGEQLVGWAVEESRSRGCALVQLTTDKSRGDAHRFYARLGFEPSHEGLKMTLATPSQREEGEQA